MKKNNLFLIKLKLKIKNKIFNFLINIRFNCSNFLNGDWGLGIGDWGLGPIPNPQSPIPNPQSPIIKFKVLSLKNNLYIK